ASAQLQAEIAAALARFAERRQSIGARRADVLRRQREAFLAKRNENAWVMFGIGGLFLVIGVVFLGLGIAGRSVGPGASFAILWFVMGGGGLYIGARYRRAGVREKRLRAMGIAGRAWVASYRDSRIVVDGNPKVELVLRVELPDRPPYDV